MNVKLPWSANFNWINPPYSDQALDSWQLTWKDNRLFQIWACIPAAIWWTLWKERNKGAFEGRQRSSDMIIVTSGRICFLSYNRV